MGKKITIIAITFAVLAVTQPAYAQQSGKVWRIGTLFSGSPATHGHYVEWFRQGLRDLGYVEGRNYVLVSYWAMGKRKRIRRLAAELVKAKVDVIFVNGGTVVRAVGKATRTIPIVVGSATGLGTYGFVSSLARPGGNVTGSTSISHELAGKRMQLLNKIVPGIRRVAYLHTGRKRRSKTRKQTEAAGKAMGVKIQPFSVKSLEDLERAFAAMKGTRPDAILAASGSVIFYHKKRLLAFANSMNVPVMCTRVEMARTGCLITYVPDRTHQMRRAAAFVDKILKGAKPGELPVERPTKFRLVINLKAAKTLGITVPPSILLQTTEVIE
ncbi:MAG: ABC transporter substrate-binding protein [Alphaproteobacteria bacterium]|nr:ABC transporter substrate-binding protein [Alphaproteobacteria bacterium]